MSRLSLLISILTLLALGCSESSTPSRIPSPSAPDASAPPSTPMTPGTPTADASPTPTPPPTPGTPDASPTPPMSPDASTPPPSSTAGVVDCGDETCTLPGEVCCVSLSGLSCTAEGSCTGFGSAPGYCDGPDDCTAGDACCVTFSLGGRNGAYCEPGCGDGSFYLCGSDSDCPTSETCIPCRPPTGGILDVTYDICSASPSCPTPFTDA